MTRLRSFGWTFAAAGALALAAACAHVEAPPGGDPDQEAPVLETTRPDTFAALRSYVGAVVFSYNEGLSERGIDTVVTVSPRTSAVAVDKNGNEIRVQLRRGWEPNRVYRVTVHPGLSDLFGNATKEPATVVFSTGPEIVRTVATGTVVERTTLQPSRGARVEAIHQPDSVLYETRPDSIGRWTLEYLPEGSYRVRAYNDTNRDQALQPYEAQDTTVITVTRRDTARARRLALIAPDTTAPVPGTATGDSTVVEVRFDDFLDPAQPLSPTQVTITGPGGAAVPVTLVRVGPFPQEQRDTAAADTGRAARRDTAAARREAAAAAARSAEPVPSQSLFIRVAQPLAANTDYTVAVRGIRNLLGLAGTGQVEFRTPRAQPQPARTDTAGAAAARPPAGAPQPRPPAAPPAPPAPVPQTAPQPVAQPPRPRR